jgi:hypothetical protein
MAVSEMTKLAQTVYTDTGGNNTKGIKRICDIFKKGVQRRLQK